ncbi:MAG: Smr/MutS family protein [Deltaproteobacteria bacterium]|nr:Smr/MutS family protein [Deltaproteobacteria bacterium]
MGATKNDSDHPFQGLAELRAKLLAQERAAKAQPRPKPPPPTEVAPPVKVELDGDSLFQLEMADVTPISAGKRLAAEPPDPKSFKRPDLPDEDMEVLDHLTDLVSGRAEFDLTFSDEHIEGYRKDLPIPILRQLRQGRVPTQDYLDLHGLNLKQAEEAIVKFILRSVALGRQCLLVIHGRGHRSTDGVPVLKRSLERLLLRWPIKRHILAFTTAQPVDGGLGASYVLLRRSKGKV